MKWGVLPLTPPPNGDHVPIFCGRTDERRETCDGSFSLALSGGLDSVEKTCVLYRNLSTDAERSRSMGWHSTPFRYYCGRRCDANNQSEYNHGTSLCWSRGVLYDAVDWRPAGVAYGMSKNGPPGTSTKRLRHFYFRIWNLLDIYGIRFRDVSYVSCRKMTTTPGVVRHRDATRLRKVS